MNKTRQKVAGNIVNAVLEQASKASKGSASTRKELETFIQEFYEFVPAEDLTRYGAKNLYAAAKSFFDFMQVRPKGAPKIRIFNPTTDRDKWHSEHTVIEIVNDDMPFLVDSVTEEIARHGLNIYQLAHPVVEVIRDEKGKYRKLKPIKQGQVGEDAESIMHFRVSCMTSDAAIGALEKDLQRVLKAIRFAVEDWKLIVKKTNYVITEFTSSTEILSRSLQGKEQRSVMENILEIREFLEWLKNNNFVFLGYVEYGLASQNKSQLTAVKGSKLGIFRLGDSEIEPKHKKILSAEELLSGGGTNLLEITKANKKSLVHRPVHMDYIIVKRFDADGRIVGEHRFLGMFTSIVYHQSAKLIPIIRKKIESIQKRSRFARSGHSGKALVAILEDFPRDELFQAPEDQLFETAMGIEALSIRPQVRLFVRKDDLERFMSCIIYIPRDRMSTQLRNKMETILAESFNGTVSNHYTQITESHLARLQVIIKTQPGKVPPYDVAQIEDRLEEATKLWEDGLREELNSRLGEKDGEAVFEIYRNAFSLSYKNRFTAEDAYYDIRQMVPVIDMGKVGFDLYRCYDDGEEIFSFKVYNPQEQITLSEIMPMLENMGIHTLDEHTYLVTPGSTDKSIWIHRFRFKVNGARKLNLRDIKENFEEAIDRIWAKQIQDDGLNRLILWAGLKWHHVVLIRAYSKYLQQAGFIYSQAYIQEALGNHPALAAALVDLFYIRFDPAYRKDRKKAAHVCVQGIEKELGRVSNLAEDRVVRAIMELIFATLRSNYFQGSSDGQIKHYVSFKLDSAKISILPKPCPYAEIFVYSPRVEGIHLRGGKVARGGLRWSDRREDFRTEVLGLMKAQMTKNSVIIPVGSKGGFVVKQPPESADRKAFMEEGIECYKIFLRGLLDITDNMTGGKVRPPENVVRYDGDDPYLVVAADKGTATFSDIANSVSAEYGFWLGDAFASGGSAGYDHKKMGITARGAWISVQRHFGEIGIDVQKQDFTVIGIGDMAGDVFGNGMLCSPHIRLVGAFNHMHIFIDPAPDAAASFKERKRLFNLPRSSWSDYNAQLISRGGGVFERGAKSIKLSSEMKQLLETDAAAMNPDELIRALLRCPADLLWNGGIGTYIKSKKETNDDVGDKANDALRVNGAELRVKVVGEGGNLGMTQLGRIEYALHGGRLNTDAIDNSAGVDCSDHEVNIKIALGQAVEGKKLTLKARDTLLESMTDEVAKLVLRDNFLQTQALTIAERQGHALLSTQARLISSMEKSGHLDREIEFLPSEEEIAARHASGKGLVRPELSVVLAYSKLTLYGELLKTDLPDDEHYNADLIRYFPEKLRTRFKKEIETHPLRREIVATAVTNSIVNRIGSTRFYNIQESTGMGVDDIARAYTITRDVFELRSMWKEIEGLRYKIKVEAQVELFVEIQNLIERTSLWFLRRKPCALNVAKTVDLFAPGIRALSECLTQILPPVAEKAFERRLEKYLGYDVPPPLARQMAGLEAMSSACDIVQVASKAKLPVNVVGKVYYDVGALLQLGLLRRLLARMVYHSYWEKTSLNTLANELFDEQRRLASEVIKTLCKDDSCTNSTERWMEANREQIERYSNFMDDLKAQEEPSLSMIIVAIRKVKEICAV